MEDINRLPRNSKYIHMTLMTWSLLPHIFLWPLLVDIKNKAIYIIACIVVVMILLEGFKTIIILYKNFRKVRLSHPIIVITCTVYASLLYLPFEEHIALKGSMMLLLIPSFLAYMVILGQLSNDEITEKYISIIEKPKAIKKDV